MDFEEERSSIGNFGDRQGMNFPGKVVAEREEVDDNCFHSTIEDIVDYYSIVELADLKGNLNSGKVVDGFEKDSDKEYNFPGFVNYDTSYWVEDSMTFFEITRVLNFEKYFKYGQLYFFVFQEILRNISYLYKVLSYLYLSPKTHFLTTNINNIITSSTLRFRPVIS